MPKLPKGFNYSQDGSVLVIILLAIILISFSVFGTYFAINNKWIPLPGLSDSSKTTQIQPTPAPKETKLKGVLALKEGSVALEKSPGVWEEITKGTTLKEGDILRTGYRSRAVVELDDGSALRLDQQTQVTLSSLGDQVIMLTQDNGRVYHRVNPGKLVYNVKSLGTVATALGTSFSVTTDTKKQTTEVAVYESKVAIVEESQGASTEVKTGEKAVVSRDEKVAVQNTTEAEKKEAFIAWNQTLDKEPVAIVTPSPTPAKTPKTEVVEQKKETTATTTTSNSLSLTVEARTNGALMKWTGDSSNGFKACYSEHENPSYPSDNCTYKSAGERTHEIGGLTAGKTYHFRVGIFGTDSKVNIYSNDATTVPKAGSSGESSPSNSQKLTLSASSNEAGKVSMSWTLEGGELNGFKTVYGEKENPVYPGDTWHYLGTGTRSDTFSELTSGKTYHFRVGLYGDGVKVYSNDVTVTVK